MPVPDLALAERAFVNPAFHDHTSRWEAIGRPNAHNLTALQEEYFQTALKDALGGRRNQYRSLQTHSLVAPKEVGAMVRFIESKGSQDLQDAVHSQIVSRVARATDALVSFRTVGLGGHLQGGLLVDSVRGVPIHWSNDQIRAGGQYSPSTKKIDIKSGPPTLAGNLRSLANLGYLNGDAGILEHEAFHAFQLNNLPNPGSQTPDNRIFIEVQAYRSTSFSRLQTAGETARHIKTARGSDGTLLYGYVSGAKVDAAVAIVDRMRAINMTPGEVVEEISEPGFWDDTGKTFPRLVKVVNDRASFFGLTEESLVIMVKIKQMEDQIGKLTTRVITQEALKAAA